jgi:predicted DNA binding protein
VTCMGNLRRLVLEMPIEDVSGILGGYLLKIDYMETLAILRDSPEEVTVICRVKLKEPFVRIKKALPKTIHVETIETKDEFTHTILFTMRRPKGLVRLRVKNIGAYFSLPYEIRNSKMKAALVGSSTHLKKLLRVFGSESLRYNIISIGDANIPYNSPLSFLTDKQRRVLEACYSLGYYDLPKKTSTREIAEKLNMRSSTLVLHRIKAEKRLLNAIFEEQH